MATNLHAGANQSWHHRALPKSYPQLARKSRDKTRQIVSSGALLQRLGDAKAWHQTGDERVRIEKGSMI
jgi:hypothetical protein